MNPDVFLSLLALDAYNRGYGRKVFANGNAIDGNEGGLQIGNATILNVDLPSGSEAAGFYAIAYDCKGETIISFRGTNFPNDLRNVTEAEFNALVAHASARTATAHY
jgi:hypothetical protein